MPGHMGRGRRGQERAGRQTCSPPHKRRDPGLAWGGTEGLNSRSHGVGEGLSWSRNSLWLPSWDSRCYVGRGRVGSRPREEQQGGMDHGRKDRQGHEGAAVSINRFVQVPFVDQESLREEPGVWGRVQPAQPKPEGPQPRDQLCPWGCSGQGKAGSGIGSRNVQISAFST